MINTKFWSDGWIVNLDPLERYLFLYLLTNEHTNICGIYELPKRIIARESGIDDDMVLKMFSKISDKVIYVDGWICIRNFLKHQKSSGNVNKGIQNGLKEIPPEILAKLKDFLNTPPSVSDTAQYFNFNLNLNPSGEKNSKSNFSTSTKKSKDFFSNQKDQDDLIDRLKTDEKFKHLDRNLIKAEIAKFINFWTEPTKRGDKQKWESKDTFDVYHRLVTWMGKYIDYSGKSDGKSGGIVFDE